MVCIYWKRYSRGLTRNRRHVVYKLHAHLPVFYPPNVAVSTLAMTLKTISSIRVQARHQPEVRNALWGDHFWSPPYCVLSCGGTGPGAAIRSPVHGP